MRCTVDFDTRVSSAICRVLQCVPFFGFVSSVLRTNRATRSSLIGRGRPGRNSSCNPDISCSKNRRRHLPTVALVSPIRRAICWFVLPEALSKIILARLTSPAGRDREPAIPSSCSRCSGRNIKAAFGRPMAIDTPILHWKCLYSQQYYCHLFMGQDTTRGRRLNRTSPSSLPRQPHPPARGLLHPLHGAEELADGQCRWPHDGSLLNWLKGTGSLEIHPSLAYGS
jgi:hypothetical protein